MRFLFLKVWKGKMKKCVNTWFYSLWSTSTSISNLILATNKFKWSHILELYYYWVVDLGFKTWSPHSFHIPQSYIQTRPLPQSSIIYSIWITTDTKNLILAKYDLWVDLRFKVYQADSIFQRTGMVLGGQLPLAYFPGYIEEYYVENYSQITWRA